MGSKPGSKWRRPVNYSQFFNNMQDSLACQSSAVPSEGAAVLQLKEEDGLANQVKEGVGNPGEKKSFSRGASKKKVKISEKLVMLKIDDEDRRKEQNVGGEDCTESTVSVKKSKARIPKKKPKGEGSTKRKSPSPSKGTGYLEEGEKNIFIRGGEEFAEEEDQKDNEGRLKSLKLESTYESSSEEKSRPSRTHSTSRDTFIEISSTDELNRLKRSGGQVLVQEESCQQPTSILKNHEKRSIEVCKSSNHGEKHPSRGQILPSNEYAPFNKSSDHLNFKNLEMDPENLRSITYSHIIESSDHPDDPNILKGERYPHRRPTSSHEWTSMNLSKPRSTSLQNHCSSPPSPNPGLHHPSSRSSPISPRSHYTSPDSSSMLLSQEVRILKDTNSKQLALIQDQSASISHLEARCAQYQERLAAFENQAKDFALKSKDAELLLLSAQKQILQLEKEKQALECDKKEWIYETNQLRNENEKLLRHYYKSNDEKEAMIREQHALHKSLEDAKESLKQLQTLREMLEEQIKLEQDDKQRLFKEKESALKELKALEKWKSDYLSLMSSSSGSKPSHHLGPLSSILEVNPNPTNKTWICRCKNQKLKKELEFSLEFVNVDHLPTEDSPIMLEYVPLNILENGRSADPSKLPDFLRNIVYFPLHSLAPLFAKIIEYLYKSSSRQEHP